MVNKKIYKNYKNNPKNACNIFVDLIQYISNLIGVSPSGKATDSDSVTRWFESSHPCQIKKYPLGYFFIC